MGDKLSAQHGKSVEGNANYPSLYHAKNFHTFKIIKLTLYGGGV